MRRGRRGSRAPANRRGRGRPARGLRVCRGPPGARLRPRPDRQAVCLGRVGPGSYDCSGLTRAAWKAAGVALPRATRDQSGAGALVPLSEALHGDLVFFHADVSHVGVYAGAGMVVHSPRPGACVREEPVFRVGERVVHVVRPA
ncbi:C40 family peptidase [Streptomyces sp. NPDC015220]|uniref:C40 family peptidase n=1 Tax=Streptomyces sp. NPDC015220 TaxID=3364947 RepID=UPI0036F8D44C